MVKFMGKKNGKPFIGLGLSRANIERMMQGFPILVKGEELGKPEFGEITIFFGETEKGIVDDLVKTGMISKSMVAEAGQ